MPATPIAPVALPISSSHAVCLACRCPPRLSSRRHLVVVSSSRPVHRLVISLPRSVACLPPRRFRSPIISSAISGNSACLPFIASALRPVLRPAPSSRLFDPFSRWTSPPCPIAPRPCSCLLSSFAPLCLSHGWERDGTGRSSSPVHLATVACFFWRSVAASVPVAAVCLLTRSAGRFVSVLWWRNCIYDLSCCYNIM